jgi:uncharacterized protein (TIGR02001 family)
MFKRFRSGLAVLTLIVICSSVAIAEEASKIDFEVTTDFYSKYIWRGINVNDDYVFQPGISASYKGLTAGVWGNLDLTDYLGEEGEFSEVDYYLDYSAEVPGIDGVSYSVGVINYHFPSLVGDTTEIYWGFAFDLPLSPMFTVYHDIDEIDGTYASFAVGHEFGTIADLGGGVEVGMDFGASLGIGDSDYNTGYWGTKDAALNDLALSVSFPFEVAGFSVSPSLNYVSIVDGGIRSADGASSDYFFTGISLSKSF